MCFCMMLGLVSYETTRAERIYVDAVGSLSISAAAAVVPPAPTPSPTKTLTSLMQLLHKVEDPSQLPEDLSTQPHWEDTEFYRAATALSDRGFYRHAVSHLLEALQRFPRRPHMELELALGSTTLALFDAAPAYPVSYQIELFPKLLASVLDILVPIVIDETGRFPKDSGDHSSFVDRTMRLLARCGTMMLSCPDRHVNQLHAHGVPSQLPPWPWEPSAEASNPTTESITAAKKTEKSQVSTKKTTDESSETHSSSTLDAWPTGLRITPQAECKIDRRIWPFMSKEEFDQDFAGPRRPVIVGNLTASWASNEWRRSDGRTQRADILEDFRVDLARTFVRNAMRVVHDAPPSPATPVPDVDVMGPILPEYFDAHGSLRIPLDEGNLALPVRHALLSGYTRPDIFEKSWFGHCKDAPSQQSLLVSAAGSATGWNVDLFNTSKWTTLIAGRVLWALFPPHWTGPPPGSMNMPPIQFFSEILPQLPLWEQPLQCILTAGETMYVPSGWWHSTVSLDPTLAITESIFDHGNAAEVLFEIEATSIPNSAARVEREAFCETILTRPQWERPAIPNCDAVPSEASAAYASYCLGVLRSRALLPVHENESLPIASASHVGASGMTTPAVASIANAALPSLPLSRMDWYFRETNSTPPNKDYPGLQLISCDRGLPVFAIDDFLTQGEVTKLLELGAQGSFDASTAPISIGELPPSDRTSTNVFLHHNETIVLRRKIGTVLNHNSDAITSGKLLRYTQGQLYSQHHDGDYSFTIPRCKEVGILPTSDVVWSFFIYLNTVYEGGETAFYRNNSDSSIYLKVPPQTGRAVFFPVIAVKAPAGLSGYRDVWARADPDEMKRLEGGLLGGKRLVGALTDAQERSSWIAQAFTEHGVGVYHESNLHSGLPVVRGHKYTANFWPMHYETAADVAKLPEVTDTIVLGGPRAANKDVFI